MKQNIDQLKLSLILLKEGKKIVAYSPELDLSTCASTVKTAKKRFDELLKIFFEELAESNNTANVLLSLGWQQSGNNWIPPKLLSHSFETIKMPVAV